MKIEFFDKKSGEAKLKLDSLEDIWCLHRIVRKGDFVRGRAERKIKVGDDERSVKKSFVMTIEVEKSDIGSRELRINGIIREGCDDVPLGVHQTIEVSVGDRISIKKGKWLVYERKKLEEATEDKPLRTMLVLFDREQAYFILLKRNTYQKLSSIKGDVQKKRDDTKKESRFYEDIVKQIKAYVQRYKIEKIISASPAFWKDELLKQVRDKSLKNTIVSVPCSTIGESGIKEVLRDKQVRHILLKDKISKELEAVEHLLKLIKLEKPAAYGIKDVERAVHEGRAAQILITDKLLQKHQLDGTLDDIDRLLEQVEKSKGKIMIVESDNESGKILDGLGGIGAVLRY